MARKKIITPDIEYGMLGETARSEIAALVASLPRDALFDDLENGTVLVAQRMARALMGYAVELMESEVPGEKKMSPLRVR